jgi:hypothetical protein
MSIAVTDAITTLAESERRFGLMRTEEEGFLKSGSKIGQNCPMWIEKS